MDKIALKTFISNSCKPNRRKFHNYLACQFTACLNAGMNLKCTATNQQIQFLNNEIIHGSWGVRWTLNCLTVNSNFPKRIPILLIWESPRLFQQNNSSPSFSACKLLINRTGFLASCSLTCTTPDTSGAKKLGPRAFFGAMFLLALIPSVF